MKGPPISGGGLPWRWIVAAGCIGVTIVVVLLLERTIEHLRLENEHLRNRPPPAPAAPAPSAKIKSPDTARANETELSAEAQELLRLRGETGVLRREVASLHEQLAQTTPVPSAAPSPAAEAPYREEVRQLVNAAMNGDAGALDKLGNLLLAMRGQEGYEALRAEIRQAFQALGAEAGGGNTAALQAVWQATRIKALQGHAVDALGVAAGRGNTEALEALLNPEAYLILRSSAVSALGPAAEAGNPQAIQGLAAVTADPKQRALWYMATQGLEPAAVAGNATAIDALAAVAASENKGARERAVLALEAAARGKQSRAEEALRKLGWR
ncbi:MAG: hypothetical protein AB1705_20005 [Verrucomicrobiota bacterium]